MPKLMKTCLIIVFFLLQFSISYAESWKHLHEEADRTNLEQALANLENKPDSSDNLYLLGLVYLNLHKDKEAEECFNKILLVSKDEASAKWGGAEVLRRKHDLDKAEEILKGIIVLSPGFSPAYISLAYIRFTKLDFQDALNIVSKVINQGTNNVDLSNYTRAYLLSAGARGMLAHYGGPLAKLINGTSVYPDLKRAEALQPDNAGVSFGLGAFYLLAPRLVGGNIDRAEAYLKKSIQTDPKFSDAYLRLAQVYKIKGDKVKYEDYLNKALEIDSKNELALDIKTGKCNFICFDEKK